MDKDLDKEILIMANKIHWAFGETLYRVKKMKAMLDDHPDIEDHIKVSMNALLNSLNEISSLYRHDIADKIRKKIKG